MKKKSAGRCTKRGNKMSDIRIQDDLYEYVNGDWLQEAVIPDDRPTIGGFATLAVDVENKMMGDIKDMATGKLSTNIEAIDDALRLYNKVLDTNKRNQDGIKPLLPLLHKIQDIKNINDLNANIKELTSLGVSMPIDFGVCEDMNDANKYSFVVKGPNTILPDTTYYTNDQGQALLNVYSDMAKKLLAYTNLSIMEQEQYLKDALVFDSLVAKEVKSNVEWADYVKNNNPMSIDDVNKYLAPFDLKNYLQELYGLDAPSTIIVYDPKAIKEFNNYFNTDTFKAYVHWAYVDYLIKNASKLSEELKHLSTTYKRTLTGVAKDPEVEKEAYQLISSIYSEPLGIYYGEKYFGQEAKEDVTKMVKRIIETYQKRIKNNTFLEQQTKDKAILKLSKINLKIGYPDKIDEIYSKLKVNNEDSYFEASLKLRKVLIEYDLNKLLKPVDKNKWAMPGHLVNACYDPSRNDITFPAAILQKPFYSLSQSYSENLSGIGAVIAHEISHAFDNNGAHFDEDGNMNNWWTDKDLKAFEELTKKMIKQWDGIEFAGMKLNGELVVSENIADNGGMAVTIEIMHETPNTNFEEYFKNWARIWCQKAKLEYTQYLLQNDVHSPVKLRTNMQIRNFKEWYDTFDVKESDKLYLKEEDRIIIW